jgi:hypothetical protein
MYDVKNDLWELKVKRWRKEANNREKCASAVKEAKLSEDYRAKKKLK